MDIGSGINCMTASPTNARMGRYAQVHGNEGPLATTILMHRHTQIAAAIATTISSLHASTAPKANGMNSNKMMTSHSTMRSKSTVSASNAFAPDA